MRVLLDTSVVLDHLLRRSPCVAEQLDFWQAVWDGRIHEYVSATMVTDIFYIARRALGLARAFAAIHECLEAFRVSKVDGDVLTRALRLAGSDFEDNVQIACANIKGVDAIVTRDPAGFRAAGIPVLSPAEAVARLTM